VRPLPSALVKANPVFLEVQMLPRLPFIDHFAAGRNLPHHIAQHALVSAGFQTALDLPRYLIGKHLPAQYQRVAVGQTLEIVMQERIAVLPNHVAVPVQLQDGPRDGSSSDGQQLALRAAHERDFFRRRACAQQQVSVGQKAGVADAFAGMPGVADPALHVDEAGVVSADVGYEGVAPVSLPGRVVDQAVGVVGRPAHKRTSENVRRECIALSACRPQKASRPRCRIAGIDMTEPAVPGC